MAGLAESPSSAEWQARQVSLGGAAEAARSEKNIKARNIMEFFIALYRKANADSTTM
jgi:hypothetical protein